MLDALLALADAVTPHLTKLDSEQRVAVRIKAPSPEKQDLLSQAYKRFRSEGAEGEQATHTTDEERARPQSGPGAHETVDPARNPQLQEFARVFVDAFADDPAALQQVKLTIEEALSLTPRHTSILNGALLTMSVGALESLIAGVASQHYVHKPEALDTTEREFSLSELLAFADVEDAKEQAIMRRVDDLMRGGLDDWMRWFESRLGSATRSLPANEDRLHECVQRRHLVVHNAGRVSRQYKLKTDCDEKLGTQLVVDRAYLEQAIDELEVFGTRLALLAWVKWADPPTGEAAELVNMRVYSLLEAERLEPAELLAVTAQALKCSDQLRHFLRVNEWQARKRRHGLASIAQEVESWDTSALSGEFHVAKAALLDRFEELEELVPTEVRRGTVKRAHLDEWPLFREARAAPNWPAIRPPGREEDHPTASSGSPEDQT